MSEESSYPELSSIREKVVEERAAPYHRPYTHSKGTVRVYRAAFGGMGLLFFILALLLAYRTANWHCNLIFAHCMAVKTIVASLSLFLSLAATRFAVCMTAERETVTCFAKRALKMLKKHYGRKRGETGWRQLIPFAAENSKLKAAYIDARELVYERGEETLFLMGQIRTSAEHDPESREHLLNKALLQLHEQLHQIVHDFTLFSV